MKTILHTLVVCVAIFSLPLTAASLDESGHLTIHDIKFQVPQGWKLHQNAKSESTVLVGFNQGADYLQILVDPSQSIEMKDVFGHDAEILEGVSTEAHGPFQWEVIETSKTPERKGTN